MPATFYPAVIDRSASGFGVSFPDFPGCVAAGDSPSEAAVNAEAALAFHIETMNKDGDAIPDPSDIGAIEDVEGADDVARILVRIDLPAKVARVLVSIDENLLRAIDAHAPNRSAFLADAARMALRAQRGYKMFPADSIQDFFKCYRDSFSPSVLGAESGDVCFPQGFSVIVPTGPLGDIWGSGVPVGEHLRIGGGANRRGSKKEVSHG